jgi:hypothetical protein
MTAPKQPITNSDLQKIWDMALEMWKERSNVEYEPRLWTTLCYVRAYCAFAGLTPPKELYRDHYGPDQWPEIAEPVEDKDKK